MRGTIDQTRQISTQQMDRMEATVRDILVTCKGRAILTTRLCCSRGAATRTCQHDECEGLSTLRVPSQ